MPFFKPSCQAGIDTLASFIAFLCSTVKTMPNFSFIIAISSALVFPAGMCFYPRILFRRCEPFYFSGGQRNCIPFFNAVAYHQAFICEADSAVPNLSFIICTIRYSIDPVNFAADMQFVPGYISVPYQPPSTSGSFNVASIASF